MNELSHELDIKVLAALARSMELGVQSTGCMVQVGRRLIPTFSPGRHHHILPSEPRPILSVPIGKFRVTSHRTIAREHERPTSPIDRIRDGV